MPTGSSDGYTQYTVMYDLHRRELYLQPYDATAWTRVALRDCSSARIEYHPTTIELGCEVELPQFEWRLIRGRKESFVSACQGLLL